jgi:hypothetical protein
MFFCDPVVLEATHDWFSAFVDGLSLHVVLRDHGELFGVDIDLASVTQPSDVNLAGC